MDGFKLGLLINDPEVVILHLLIKELTFILWSFYFRKKFVVLVQGSLLLPALIHKLLIIIFMIIYLLGILLCGKLIFLLNFHLILWFKGVGSFIDFYLVFSLLSVSVLSIGVTELLKFYLIYSNLVMADWYLFLSESPMS